MMLKGKTAIITGGGTGIGAAITRRFAAEGAKVCVVGRREGLLEQVVQSLPSGTAVMRRGDVSEPGHIDPIIETALSFGKKIDILVNNAGIGSEGSITSAKLDEWHKTLEVNLIGPFMLMRAAIPHMIENGGGSIINISSLASLRAIPQGSAYCASKSGLNMLTQQAALDFGGDRIRCNVICPGFVFSEMTESRFGQIAKDMGADLDNLMARVFRDIPSREPAQPEKIAGLCAFLASDEASYITGAVIPVDGGLTSMDPFPLCVNNAIQEMMKEEIKSND
ncbi:MAG: SDR family oxidoreductase [Deltaproteobacteria bacterium]|nr:SDR family oxidoreductase [Deltaproteobacteria bacterium]